MNFYNPYMYSFPNSIAATSGTVNKLTFSSFINGTSKTLNLINQAIPVFKQVSPMFKNMKTMFKVMNEFKKNDNLKDNNYNNSISNNQVNYVNDGKPTFFI